MNTETGSITALQHTMPLDERIEEWRKANKDSQKDLAEAIKKHLIRCVIYLPLIESYTKGHTAEQAEERGQRINDILLEHAILDCIEFSLPLHLYLRDGLSQRIHDVLTNLSFEEDR